MFEKILYPVDFSDVSKKALAYIKKTGLHRIAGSGSSSCH